MILLGILVQLLKDQTYKVDNLHIIYVCIDFQYLKFLLLVLVEIILKYNLQGIFLKMVHSNCLLFIEMDEMICHCCQL